MRLFISYAHVDRPLCEQVVEDLSLGHEVWYDKHILAGADWWEDIKERLNWCEGFVYLLSPESVTSEYCQQEYELARDAGKLIFPVKIQSNTVIPDDILRYQVVDSSGGWSRGPIVKLMSGITRADVQRARQATVEDDSSSMVIEVNEGDRIFAEANSAYNEGRLGDALFKFKQIQASGYDNPFVNLDGLIAKVQEKLDYEVYYREAERLYQPLPHLINSPLTRQQGCKALADFHQQYPDYDVAELIGVCEAYRAEQTQQVQREAARRSPPSVPAPEPVRRQVKQRPASGKLSPMVVLGGLGVVFVVIVLGLFVFGPLLGGKNPPATVVLTEESAAVDDPDSTTVATTTAESPAPDNPDSLTPSGEEVRSLEGHSDTVESVAFSPDGQTLASGSSDNTIKLWDVTSGEEVRSLEGHYADVNSVAFSPDGQTLASGSFDYRIKFWDVVTGEQVRSIEGYSDEVYSVAFSPDGETLASGLWDRVKLWNVASGEEVHSLEGRSGSGSAVNYMAFSPDGEILASGTSDDTIKLWDVASGEEIRSIEGYDSASSMAFSPDGQILVGGSLDGTIKLWDVATGEEVRSLEGQISFVSSVAFSPDGQMLASGSDGNTIKLWDVATGETLRTLTGHSRDVTSVAFSPDGLILASSSWDGTIRLWDIAALLADLDN